MNNPDFAELKEKLCKISKRTENEPYDEDTSIYVQKLFKCEPPCDSYGVCSNCNEETIFHAGFNKGFDKSTKQSAAIITELLEIIQLQNEKLNTLANALPPNAISMHCSRLLSETNTRLQKLRDGGNGKND
jgi:hypothetical protein